MNRYPFAPHRLWVRAGPARSPDESAALIVADRLHRVPDPTTADGLSPTNRAGLLATMRPSGPGSVDRFLTISFSTQLQVVVAEVHI